MSEQSNNLIFIADPSILAVDIIENNEPLVDLATLQDILYGPSPEIPNNNDYTKLRKSVHEKIKQAQALLPSGLHFCLYEAYRSLQLQKLLFDQRYQLLKSKHVDWSHEEIFKETTRLISPVINLDGSQNIPPHSTGGAIDIYLVNDNGEPVDMGILVKDWMDDDGSNSQTRSNVISTEAKKNREIMSQALATVGFVNYPAEYWHWSYGDRLWAFTHKQSHAIYGSI